MPRMWRLVQVDTKLVPKKSSLALRHSRLALRRQRRLLLAPDRRRLGVVLLLRRRLGHQRRRQRRQRFVGCVAAVRSRRTSRLFEETASRSSGSN